MPKSYMMKTNEMPRISRHELGENFDHYLERVEKENIGFIITDEGKDDLVLCPAWWFSYCFDETFSSMVLSAVKGAFKEDGLTPGKVADFIRKNLNVIDNETLDGIVEFLEQGLKDAVDIPNPKAWEVLLLDLKAQKEEFNRRIEIINKARKTADEDKEWVTLNIDEELLKKANATIAKVKIGFSLEELISMFLEEFIVREAIPFEPWYKGQDENS